MNWRMLGPSNIQRQTMTVNGRTYSAAAGQPLDVPDFDAAILEANGWGKLASSGPTSSRPTGVLPPYPALVGTTYFDTTLNYLIEFDGTLWRNPATGAAV